MMNFPFHILIGVLPVLVVSACAPATPVDIRQNIGAGKEVLLLQHEQLPSLEPLEREIKARPSLREVRVRRVTLPFQMGEKMESRLREELEKGTPDVIYTQTPAVFGLVNRLNRKRTPVVFLTVLSLKDTGVVDDNGQRLPELEHVTGLAVHAPAHAKHLEAMQDAFPRVRRIGVLVDDYVNLEMIRQAFREFGDIEPVFLKAEQQDAVARVAERIMSSAADAWYFPQTAYLQQNSKALIPLLRQQRVRGMYGWHIASKHGGALSMQAAIPDRDKRHAEQIELILSGTPPSQIAIETASTLRVAANPDALNELGAGFNREYIKYIDFFY
ncbi:MAG: ABC transporter substrate binding protein [Burkholderiales bacterium]|nr:ABC transporter substrate binding protein [Burkholderiales bacterium]